LRGRIVIVTIRPPLDEGDQHHVSITDRYNKKVAPLLEPGEQPQASFPAQAGSSPWLTGQLGLLGMAFAKPRIIALTDRSIVVFQANAMGAPKKVLARLPRDTQIDPLKGIWAKVVLGDEKMYVHKRFHKVLTPA
jgi:hypothetical protein